MTAFYQLPFESFERYSPYGSPEEVAAFLAPYVQAGCGSFNLIPRATHADAAIEGVACQGAAPLYALRVADHSPVGQMLGQPSDRAINYRT
jgi:hypothetical protein